MPSSLLSIVNQPGGLSEGDVWFEVHSMRRIEPTISPTNPIGPFRARQDIPQRVGHWFAQRYVVYMFTSPLGSQSVDRLEVEGSTTLVVEDAGTRVLQILERGKKFAGSPNLPIWARWLIFSLVAAGVLAGGVFITFKVITTKTPQRSEDEWT
jgi:hypothetical protein